MTTYKSYVYFISSDDSLPWKTEDAYSLRRVGYQTEDRLALSDDAEFVSNDKKESMNLDEHTMASVMFGVVNTCNGASNFYNHKPDPRRVTVTLVWRGMSREEYYGNLHNLINQDFLSLPENIQSTHIVVSVFYGAEAYCVLSQDLQGFEEDEEMRIAVKERLSKIAHKLGNARNRNINAVSLKEEFDTNERHFMSSIKCTLYADLQDEHSRECNIFDAYNYITTLRQTIFSSLSIKAIPILVKICPLQVIFKQANEVIDTKIRFGCRDVGYELMLMCSVFLSNLKRTCIKAEILMDDNQEITEYCALREFVSTVSQFVQLIGSDFKDQVVSHRNADNHPRCSGTLTYAITHFVNSPFTLSNLERWLSWKQSEFDMANCIMSGVGTVVTFLRDNRKLQKHIRSTRNIKYAIVLFVPAMNRKSKDIIDKMKQFCAYFVDDIGDPEEDDPWHTQQAKRKFVMKIISEFVRKANATRLNSNETKWIVTFGEDEEKFCCSYSVYESGKLLKSNMRHLPGPPTGLRVVGPVITHFLKENKKIKSYSFYVQWDYEEQDFPCLFVVEYRLKQPTSSGNNNWTRKITTGYGKNQLSVDFVTGTTMEFRVAAKYCFCLGEFSDVVDTVSAPDQSSAFAEEREDVFRLPPPTDIEVRWLIGTTSGLKWKLPPEELRNLTFHITIWKKGEKESSTVECKTGFDETRTWFYNLSPETTYQLHIATSLEWKGLTGPRSDILEFTTSDELRYVDSFVKRWKKIRNENDKDLFAVPLTKNNRALPTTVDRFVFNDGDHVPAFYAKQRTILLVGTSDSDKMSLINAMGNYIFNVNLEDQFSFQLVEAENCKNVKTYNIRHARQFRIDYSLTIVDTPGYLTNDPAKNKAITEMIRNFVDDENCIQQVDMIGFVMNSSVPDLTSVQLYIYCSLISIFGNDVISKLKFLLTSASYEHAYFWEDVVDAGLVYHGPCLEYFSQRLHKFDTSVFVCSDKESDMVDSFSQNMDNFKAFFLSIEQEGQMSFSHHNNMLYEKKRLRTVLLQIDSLLCIQMAQLEELQSTKQKVVNNLAKIDAGLNVEFELDTITEEKVNLPLGKYVTNCSNCKITCHNVCNYMGVKMFCDVMDQSQPTLKDTTCLICPGKCHWVVHTHQSFKWRFKQEKKTISLMVVKQKYESKLKKTLTSNELMEALTAHMLSKSTVLMEQIERAVGFQEKFTELVKRFIQNDFRHFYLNGIIKVIRRFRYFHQSNESSGEIFIHLHHLLYTAAGPDNFLTDFDNESEPDLFRNIEDYNGSEYDNTSEDDSMM